MRQPSVVPARVREKNVRVFELDPDLDAEVRKRIGGRLKALRIEAHLDQIELATQVGISPGTLQTIEWGARKNRLESIAKIAAFFGTTPKALAQKDHVAANDPLFKGLNREDLEIARAYHEASSVVRTQARQLLRDRDPQALPTPTTGDAAVLAARIARLTPERQQLIDGVIAQFETLDQRDADAS